MRKRYILYIVVILLSIINIINTNNTSALSYQSSIGIDFTFNPTLSVNISSDLIINNLVPGSGSDSNIINVSVATNASHGYTLSAIMNGNNSDLTHTNNSINDSYNVFSSIATDSSLPNLTTDNTWGYSYKLSNDTNWNNYSGLSNSVNKVLFNTDSNTSGPIDFKIAAKASNTQPSGEYTGTINFIAITKPTPMNLAESYFAHGKTRHNGYYTMQDMTTEICNDTEVIGEGSQTELIDIRDNKVYWATKLADNHCWMTQNLDLDLDSNRTYTHWDTDLGWTVMDEEAEWKPERSTINFSGATVDGWANNYTRPYSANPGDVYYYTSNSDADDIKYNSLQECINAGHNDCTHYHAGNYYNWSAAVGSNDTSSIQSQYSNAPNSVCPKNWRLPNAIDANGAILEFGHLLLSQNIVSRLTGTYRDTDSFKSIRKSPLYFIRSGTVNYRSLDTSNGYGYSISSTVASPYNIYFLGFSKNGSSPIGSYYGGYVRAQGISTRCLAR